jgi:peptidoglycan/LPS O-acetylase OafA/YrhL
VNQVPESTPRWAGLDGLRAIAVVAVLGTHFGLLGDDAAVGVDLFFVISGFLITSLLLKERDRRGAVSLGYFWARRGLRLFPALSCAILLGLVVSLATTPSMRHATIAGLPWVLLYVGNWAVALGSGQPLGVLVHTWSLAVEEQFYLVWPLIFMVWICRIRHRERAGVVMGVLAGLDCVYMIWAMNAWGPQRAFFGTDTHCMGLLAGSALALFVIRRDGQLEPRQSFRRTIQVAGLVALILFCVLCLTNTYSNTQSGVTISLATLAGVVLVGRLVLVPSGGMVNFLSGKLPQWIGRRSYGIYLYHFGLAVAFVQTRHLRGLDRYLVVVACLCVTVALAAASYRWVELPFLRRKARFTGPGAQVEVTETVPSSV